MGIEFWDRQGKPIDLETFGRLFGDPSYKIVRQTQVGDLVVITAWFGSDHNWGADPDTPPLIFGTIVSGRTPDGLTYYDDATEVCDPTEEEALKTHDRLIKTLTDNQ